MVAAPGTPMMIQQAVPMMPQQAVPMMPAPPTRSPQMEVFNTCCYVPLFLCCACTPCIIAYVSSKYTEKKNCNISRMGDDFLLIAYSLNAPVSAVVFCVATVAARGAALVFG
jgi:hypothetical protein